MCRNVCAGCWLSTIMFCLAATASSQTVSFQAARTYAAGVLPQSAAVADFNGDGKPDLAVADNRGGVSVLLGNGDGTFQAAVNYPVGINLTSIAVGDFNGDNKPDLVVVDFGGTTGSVWVLLGNGDGTFQAAVNYPAGTNPFSVAVGDFNGDGRLDLAVANLIGNGTVSVLLGKGDGTFQPAVSYPAGLSPRSIAVGDFNGDGKPDLAVADSNGGGVSVLLNKGDGTFPTTPAFYAAGLVPYSVAVGDFNGDGKSDLAVADVGGTVSVLFGNGTGTFQSAVNYPTGGDPISVAVADFNKDGKSDLAVANNSTNTVSVLLNDGAGTFTTVTNYVVGPGYSLVAVGDFNGDGKPDLAVTDYAGWNVSVLLGNGDGTFKAAAEYAAGGDPISVAVGDFNKDGKADLAVADYTGGVNVLLGRGDGTFEPAVSYAAGSGPSSVAVGDFNGDGKPDLAVADYNGGVSVLLGNGDGTFNLPLIQLLNPVGTSVAVGDFNGDGKLDVAVVDALCVYVLLGNGDGTLQAPVCYGAISNPASVAVGDFNGDGKPDLAVTVNGGVSVLLNNGNGAFPTAVFYPFGSYSKSVAVGDFNGDGILDLAVADVGPSITSTPGAVWVLLGNGDGTFKAAVSYAAGGYPVSVAVGDFNGDGKLDLAVANQFAGHNLDGANISVLLGNGDGTFQTAVNYAAGRGPVSLAVGDFNGDGKPDLAAANNNGGKVSVLLNTTRRASSTTLTSSPNPSTPGQSVAFTATVISSGGVPTGNVTFNDGVTALGTGPLSTSGQATLATATLSAGTHTIAAVYGGDTNYATSVSSPLTQTVKFSTTTTLTASPNPSPPGQSVTFTATVSSSGGAPTGNVAFNDGPTVLGTGTLNASGQATLATAALSAGIHTITAVYSGDANFTSSTASGSSALAQTVMFSTTTGLSSAPNPSVFGQAVTFTATVSPVAPSTIAPTSGSVQFYDGGTLLGTGNVSTSGIATFIASTLTANGSPHSISAVYGGNTNFLSSTSPTLSETVNRASTSTAVTSSANPSVFGQSVTFTATVGPVAPGDGPPTGTVQFKINGAPFGGAVILAGGSATSVSIATLLVGSYTVAVDYTNLDGNYFGSSGALPGGQTVNPAPTVSLVTVTPNPQKYSDLVTLVATLSPVAINGRSPATNVTFMIGTQTMGTVPLVASGGVLTGTLANLALLEPTPFGTAPTGQMAPGPHMVTAVFSGVDLNFIVVSPTTTLTITQEDAAATYTGALFASTSGSTSLTATVTLSATIQDTMNSTADPNPGDIRNATVQFVNRDDNTLIGPVLPVGLVSLSDTKTGTVTYNWNVTIPSCVTLPCSQTYTIGMIVNNYYTRNSSFDNTVVNVAQPGNNSINGALYLVMTSSAGQTAGAAGTKNNSGFNVKYNKQGTNLQGNISSLVRSATWSGVCPVQPGGVYTYQVKGNSMNSLSVDTTITTSHPYATAVVDFKASLVDITNPLSICSVDGNATVQVTMTDKGGSSDTFAITVWKKSGGLWFSSDWNGTQTLEQVLGGGKLTVR